MPTLLSVGCSNTVGVDLEEEIGIFDKTSTPTQEAVQYRKDNNFSTLVANNLGYECINLGVSGASNERIVFSAIEYIEYNIKPDLVLVNLSGKSRVTFEVEGRLLDFDLTYPSDHFIDNYKINDKDFIPFINFYKKYSLTDYNLNKKQQNLYRYIIMYLESKNIPYIISHTITTGEELKNFSDKSIDISFDDFNIKAGRNRAVGYHWLSDSHKEWSELILRKIKKYYAI